VAGQERAFDDLTEEEETNERLWQYFLEIDKDNPFEFIRLNRHLYKLTVYLLCSMIYVEWLILKVEVDAKCGDVLYLEFVIRESSHNR
jgi:hypothetical protein